MTPPVVWRYDPGQASFQHSQQPLMVLPVDDRRELVNESPSWLRFVPLVIWTSEQDSVPDLILVRPHTKRHSAPNTNLYFSAENDLKEALHRHFAQSGCFGPVFRSTDQSGPWQNQIDSLPTIQLSLERLTFQKTQWRYGLGPLAPIPATFGAPTHSLEVEFAGKITLRDHHKNILYEQSFSELDTFHDGWYYRLDAEQRGLLFVSFVLADEIDEMLAGMCDTVSQ